MISNRLKSITSFVKSDEIVADIGTDHGFVPIFLLENNIAKHVYCTDISENSLQKCIDEFNGRELENRAEFLVGDGLIPLEGKKIDTVIIAGMGGYLIYDILNAWSGKKSANFILQPMQNADTLRELLLVNGFNIKDEALVYEDNRFFEIMYCSYDGVVREFEDYEFSKILLERRDSVLKSLLEFKISSTEKLIEKLEGLNSQNPRTLSRIVECKSDLERYRRYYETYEDY